MAMSNNAPKKRKRGIRASRVKLEKAMESAGFKTQASLAEAIADKEGIDTPPKDAVSKVFRELNVAPSSIQRIASVLCVEAYTLYKSSSEENLEINDEDVSSPTNKSPSNASKFQYNIRSVFLLFFGLICITAIIYATYRMNTGTKSEINQIGKYSYKKPLLGHFSLVIDADEKSKEIVDFPQFFSALKNTFTASDYTNFGIDSSSVLMPNQILQELQTDFFIQLKTIEFDKFVSVNATLFADNMAHQFWSVPIRRSHIEGNISLFIQDLVSSIHFETGIIPEYSSLFNEAISTSSVHDYLKGRSLLDESQNPDNIQKAQSYFVKATNESPNFASAYAGLCEAFLAESWTSENEKLLLEEAQLACDKANNINPGHPYIDSVQMYLLRRTGRVKEALEIYDKKDNSWKTGVDYTHALAALKFDAFRQSPENQALLEEARKLANDAISMDPSYWKSYNTLTLIEFSAGNTQKAIDAMEIAVTYNPNELSYVNLGTLNLCQSNKEKAIFYFSESLKLTDDHYLANEMIGLLHYFNRNYQESYDFRKRALEISSGYAVHNIYGAAAESAEKLQLVKEATELFYEAKKVIERDKLRGNITPTDQAIETYYDVKLKQLNHVNNEIDDDTLLEKINEFTNISTDLESAAIIRLAIAQAYFGHDEQAKKLIKTASERCPIYLDLPDLDHLFQKNIELVSGS